MRKAFGNWSGRRLPDYMEPTAFVWMDSLPLTPNGKVDRAALPVPKIGEGAGGRTFVAPRTPVEETLAGIISEVLKVPRVSVDDDFFHLGAHSLLGAQIIARVRGAFGTELRLLDVFDAPTVAELSLQDRAGANAPAQCHERSAKSKRRSPLWIERYPQTARAGNGYLRRQSEPRSAARTGGLWRILIRSTTSCGRKIRSTGTGFSTPGSSRVTQMS